MSLTYSRALLFLLTLCFSLFSADEMGVYDLYMVKRQMFVSAAVISSQLLLVDEIMKAGHGQK
jgi:chaperonin GroEL (HSP60 family)